MCGVLLAPLSPFHFNSYLLCCVLSFNIIVKRCEAAHAWVVSGTIEISIYYYLSLQLMWASSITMLVSQML